MSDLINRQAALEIIQSLYPGMPRVPWLRKDWQERYEPYINAEKAIRTLPSAQPEAKELQDVKVERDYWKQRAKYTERKKGEWTDNNACPFCEFQPWYEGDIHTLSFCPNCGADMRGKENE